MEYGPVLTTFSKARAAVSLRAAISKRLSSFFSFVFLPGLPFSKACGYFKELFGFLLFPLSRKHAER
jgi:hypothetical protein